MEPVDSQTRGESAATEMSSGHTAASAPASPGRPERRRKPRTWETPPAPVPPPHLDDYQNIVGAAEIDELRFLARELKGKTVKMVNSTAVGGGVAEMLNQMVPLLNEVEVRTHWDVITGGNDFFEVTKAFHNALQSSEYKLAQHARDIFLMNNEQNRQRIQFEEDFIVIHDPQPRPSFVRVKSRVSGGYGAATLTYPTRTLSLGISSTIHRELRRFNLFIAIVCSTITDSSVFVLPLHRSTIGKKQGCRRQLYSTGMR